MRRDTARDQSRAISKAVATARDARGLAAAAAELRGVDEQVDSEKRRSRSHHEAGTGAGRARGSFGAAAPRRPRDCNGARVTTGSAPRTAGAPPRSALRPGNLR